MDDYAGVVLFMYSLHATLYLMVLFYADTLLTGSEGA